MQKHVLRNKIRDRAPTHYNHSVGDVLLAILDGTRVDDWQRSNIEDFHSKPLTVATLKAKARLSESSVVRALKILLKDGVIKMNPHTVNSYKISTSAILGMESRYKDEMLEKEIKQLTAQILKAVRMRFTRNPQRKPTWAGIHPEECTCVRRSEGLEFCSYTAPDKAQLTHAA